MALPVSMQIVSCRRHQKKIINVLMHGRHPYLNSERRSAWRRLGG